MKSSTTAIVFSFTSTTTKPRPSRTGLNWIKRFSVIAGAFAIPGQAIIDGEVVVVHEGRTNFSELQADLAKGDQDRLLHCAFDLLWLDGTDLRKLPQAERKRILKELFDIHGLEAPAIYSEHLVGPGQQFFEHAAKLKYEGITYTWEKSAPAGPARSRARSASNSIRSSRRRLDLLDRSRSPRQRGRVFPDCVELPGKVG
nr:hypothetical protein [Bradyrhizobium manausense]